jgi:undecaprenyl-diphosphatase
VERESQLQRERTLLLIALLFLVGFLLVAIFRDNFAAANLAVNQWAASINTGSFTIVAQGISVAFDTTVLASVSVVVAAFLFAAHQRRYGLLLITAMVGDAVLVSAGKTLVVSARPLNEILFQSSNSFPSGHVTGSVIFFGVLTYFAWTRWNSTKVKAATGALYVIAVGVVGFDRIYLNVHWFSDVVGAVFLGAFWLTLSIVVFKHLLHFGKLQRFLSQNPKTKATSCGKAN